MLTRYSENYPQLHDKYLSILSEQVGIFPTQENLVFYTTPGVNSESVSMHTIPIGIVDHALVLTGENGLYDLKDGMPALTDPAPSATYSWREFVLEEESNAVLWRAASEGKWVVFPGSEQGSFEVKWNDGMYSLAKYQPKNVANTSIGTGFTTQDYLPIEVVFEEVEKP